MSCRAITGLIAIAAALVCAVPASAAVPGQRGDLYVSVNGSAGDGWARAPGQYRVDPQTLAVEKLTQQGAPSPDGTKLAFPDPGGAAFKVRDLATGLDTTYLASPHQGLLWSPDATEIYAPGGGVIVSLDGGAARHVTPDVAFFQPTVWGIDGIYGPAASTNGQLISAISALGRMSPTSGHVDMLRQPSESFRPNFEALPVPRNVSGNWSAGGIGQFSDISPDGSEALVFDTDRTDYFYVCELQPEDCGEPPSPGCLGYGSFSGGGIDGICFHGQSYARLDTGAGTIDRADGWVGSDLSTFPFFGKGLKVPVGYTPDGETVIVEHTGDERFQQSTGYSVKVDGEPTVLFQNSGGSGSFSQLVQITWTAKTLAVPVTDRPGQFSGPSTSISFGAPAGNPDGVVECSRDGGIFLECESPLQLTDLSEGEHVVRIRFVPDVGAAGPSTVVRWTVDTTPPVARIDSSPSGVDPSPNASIAFSTPSTDVDLFRCKLDDGPEEPCASPFTIGGLEDGGHTFSVVAVDLAGLRSAPAVAQWEVKRPEKEVPPPAPASPGPPAPPSGGGGGAAPSGCEQKFVAGPVIAVTEQGCFVITRPRGVTRATHDRAVKVNGIEIEPRAGTQVEVERDAQTAAVRWDGPARITVGPLKFDTTHPQEWDGLSLGNVAVVNRMLSNEEGNALNQGWSIVPKAPSIELSASKGGQAKLTIGLTFPKLFSLIPGTDQKPKLNSATGLWEGGGAAFEISPRVSNDEGFVLAGKAQAKEAYLFGRVRVKDLTLGFDTGERTLSFSGILGLSDVLEAPGIGLDKGAELLVSLSVGPDGIAGTPLRELKVLAQKIEKHLGYGFFLQRLGGGLGTRPGLVTVGGQLGLSWGPRLQVGGFSGELVSFDGTGSILIPTSAEGVPGPGVELTGVMTTLGVFQSNEAKLLVQPPKTSLSGRWDMPTGYGVFRFQGQLVRGEFDRASYVIEARGGLTFPLLGEIAGAEVLANERGWAACAQVHGFRVGVAAPAGAPASSIDPIVDGCDLERLVSSRPRTAQAGGAQTVSVPGDTKLLALAIRGRDGAPPVRLTSPSGETFDLRPEIGRRDERIMAFPDATRGELMVLVSRPAAGSWRVEGLDGAVIAGVTAGQDAAPELKGRAKVGRDGRVSLDWNGSLPRGAKIEFAETGAGQRAALFSTGSAKGRRTFTPNAGLGIARRLVALVTRDGLPVARIDVAQYRVADRPPAAPKLKLKGRKLTWRRVAGAKRYVVAVEIAGRPPLSKTVKRTSLTLPRSTPKKGVIVRVVGIDGAGRVGKAALVRR